MPRITSRKPPYRRWKALTALFAATAALTGGAQAFAPGPAMALQIDCAADPNVCGNASEYGDAIPSHGTDNDYGGSSIYDGDELKSNEDGFDNNADLNDAGANDAVPGMTGLRGTDRDHIQSGGNLPGITEPGVDDWSIDGWDPRPDVFNQRGTSESWRRQNSPVGAEWDAAGIRTSCRLILRRLTRIQNRRDRVGDLPAEIDIREGKLEQRWDNLSCNDHLSPSD
jgi:hypothetical protein